MFKGFYMNLCTVTQVLVNKHSLHHMLEVTVICTVY